MVPRTSGEHVTGRPTPRAERARTATTMPDSSGEEDDYMSMAFLADGGASSAAAPETSLQRRQRLRREGEIRGRPKSKAELAAAVAAEREEALSRSLIDDPGTAQRSKGLAMMRKMGFKGGALGAPAPAPAPTAAATTTTTTTSAETTTGGEDAPDPAARRDPAVEPIRITMKEDRGGIGLAAARKRALADAAAENERLGGPPAKQPRVMDPAEFRERSRREREARRWEAQVVAAQKVCERMEEERELGARQGEEDARQLRAVAAAVRGETTEEEDAGGDDGAETDSDRGEDEDKDKDGAARRRRRPLSDRPLKSINVLWRGLARAREEAERDRRMRYDLEQSLPTLSARLPTYDDGDAEDADDRVALGRTPLKPAYVPVQDLEEDDDELDAFAALEPDERLRRLVAFLRAEHRYCFWCKCAYPDAEMDGCPGMTEEDHD